MIFSRKKKKEELKKCPKCRIEWHIKEYSLIKRLARKKVLRDGSLLVKFSDNINDYCNPCLKALFEGFNK